MKSISSALVLIAGGIFYIAANVQPNMVSHGEREFWGFVFSVVGAVGWIVFTFVPSRHLGFLSDHRKQ
jgi:branched-subunit amino acid ABC-type transport system permease component